MTMLGDEPPYLLVGTEVSAKYKGAFCEAKVRKVDKTVKCKVSFKLGCGTHTVLDSSIKGTLRVGAAVEAKHPEKKEFVEATITKIQDCSQYTVVFDDGDITTLRRSALCLKSGRHFAESETLDQLPLTHPEHFGNPVVGGRRGRRRLLDDSSGDEDNTRKGKLKEEKEADIGKVVCVELGDKKKVKDNWFPGLVVSPNAQDTVQIRVKDEYLVRSFSDGRYYTVPKKEATEFTREIGVKVDNNTLKTAVEKALHFLDKDELPPHWDRELLFGLIDSDMNSDSDEGLDSDSSDDEPREEKDHFVAQLYKFMDDRGTPINNCPSIGGKDLDLYKLFNVVHKLNGYNRVTNRNQWKIVSTKLGLGMTTSIVTQVRHAYKKYLHSFEDFNRKLGCTMISHPRNNRARNKSGRSLIRDKDKTTPTNSAKVKNELSPCEPSKIGCKQEDVTDKETSTDFKVKEEIVSEKKDEKVKNKEDNERITKTKTIKKEVDAEDISESEDNASISEETANRPSSSLRKKFPTLKASPVLVKEKRKAENSPDERKCKRARMLKSRSNSSTDLKANSDNEEDSKNKEISDQRSTTRSRSKEDMKLKKESEKERRNKSNNLPASEFKKIPIVKARRLENEDQFSQKKGRKRRNTETGRRSPSVPEEDLNLPCLPSYKSVFIGDVLKIYYGAAGETKVIYEAKVVDIKENESGETMYLVHYAGWNSRYDEWVTRNKIADNLNWTPARSKNNQGAKSNKVSAQKRKLPANRTEQTGPGTRSTTPSSVASSSSRTKSPAASTQSANKRLTRNAGESKPKRTRRISSHTDISVDSESDSDPGESVSDVETRKKIPQVTKTENNKESVTKKRAEVKKAAPKRKINRKAIDKKVADDEEENTTSKKTKKKTNSKENNNVLEMTNEIEIKKDHSSQEDQEPKGRDFDLNQIRSELKGIDKAVKISSDLIRVDDVDEKERILLEDKAEPTELNQEIKSVPLKDEEKISVKVEEKLPEKKEVKEDVYEFKEPEPFEYQEALRPINRIFDDSERSPEKISKKPITLIDKKEISNFEGDMKNRFRKTIGKKMKELCVNERKEPTVRIEKLENMSKKLDTTLSNFQLKSAEKEIPVLKVEVEVPKPISPEPYGLFNSLREEASEIKAEYTAEKEESREVENANPKSPQSSALSPEPPSLTPMTNNNVFVEEQTTSPVLLRVEEIKQEDQKKDDVAQEEEDDPISAAIQRVIAQSSIDDDSDDMDLFSAPTNISSTEPPDISKANSARSEQKTELQTNKKLCSKRKSVGKRMILSKEFVIDDDSSTDSYSDSAEERLVIVNEDELTDDSAHCQKSSAINNNSNEEDKKVLLSPENRIKRADERKSPLSSSENLSPKKLQTNDSSTKKPTALNNDEGWKSPKQEKAAEEEGENNLRSLLCEETIPGSPTPVLENKEIAEPKLNLLEIQFASSSQPISLPPPPPPPVAKRDGNDAAAVMDNTPPTTPESNLSSISGSPREDRVGSSSLDNESSKSHRDSSEVDVDNEPDQRMRGNKYPKKPEKDPESPLKKKRRNRKRSESLSEINKRIRQPVGRPPKAKDTGSDSDDTSENSQIGNNVNSDPLINSRSQRPSKYNFYCELDPELDASQRIALLEQKIQECRKTYLNVKSRLASIDRRRKKLRRREREGRRKCSRY